MPIHVSPAPYTKPSIRTCQKHLTIYLKEIYQNRNISEYIRNTEIPWNTHIRRYIECQDLTTATQKTQPRSSTPCCKTEFVSNRVGHRRRIALQAGELSSRLTISYIYIYCIQWEFQDPKMEVLYHIRAYFLGIFPYIGLKNRPKIYGRYRQSIGSASSWPLMYPPVSLSSVSSQSPKYIPIGSMYAIYGNIYHQYTPNVTIYSIHGSYGIYCKNSGKWMAQTFKFQLATKHNFKKWQRNMSIYKDVHIFPKQKFWNAPQDLWSWAIHRVAWPPARWFAWNDSSFSSHGFRRLWSSEVPAIFLENMPWPPWKVENGGKWWALRWVLHGLIKSYLKISENDREKKKETT